MVGSANGNSSNNMENNEEINASSSGQGLRIFDPGYFESDIVLSIEEAAQGHVLWIYECMLAKVGSEEARRLPAVERLILRRRAVKLYQEYIGGALGRLFGKEGILHS